MSEVSLWNAVVATAVEDLFHGSDLERRAAFLWFFEKNADFDVVCDYAGINPKCVRQYVFSRIINGE